MKSNTLFRFLLALTVVYFINLVTRHDQIRLLESSSSHHQPEDDKEDVLWFPTKRKIGGENNDPTVQSSKVMANDIVLTPDEKEQQESHRPKILYTVFAGRKSRLLLQEPYWVEMIQNNIISELHLWNYIPAHQTEDEQHLEHLAQKYSSFLTVLQPLDVVYNETYWYDRNHSLAPDKRDWMLRAQPMVRAFTEYYAYYTQNPYDGVIIKADDDIVYVNTSMVSPFADYLWDHREIFLLSASVVNQGLCAHYQQQYGAIPRSVQHFPYPNNGMGSLQMEAKQAQKLHTWFLESEENRQRFFIQEPTYIPYNYTININFIAIRGADWHQTFELIQEQLVEEEKYYDEGAITWGAIRKRKLQQGIYMPLVAAHCTFSHQFYRDRNTSNAIEALWYDWAKRERADLYKGIL